MMDPIIYHEELRGKFEIKSRAKLATREDLSLAYTPGVAKVCEAIVENPARVYDLTRKNNLVAVVTDGSAVLGLGNIGPEASLPVMEGKCILYKEFSDVDAVPIALKTQDTEEIIRTVELISPMFGGIHLEDISAPRCFEIEERLDKMLDIPVFHDDQHGTAVVVLAAILNALELVDKKIEEIRVVVNGVGAAGVAITKLLMAGGVKNLYLVDSKGIVYDGRGDLNDVKKDLAKITNPDKRTGGLIVAMIGADVFIGVSKGNVVSGEMVKSMGEKSIVMALANPTPEIMPDLARDSGAYIVASGRSDFPNQVNNVLSFPGIFRGLLDGKIKSLTVEMKLRAARALAEYVTDLSRDKILPNPLDKEVSKVISKAIQNI
ncbi:MAG TPA: NADP-dependent malic enzyme [Patescibacteria group bacterium]|nr:NADP-dependent malic enzyme [Patescibacteria group bacterium]